MEPTTWQEICGNGQVTGTVAIHLVMYIILQVKVRALFECVVVAVGALVAILTFEVLIGTPMLRRIGTILWASVVPCLPPPKVWIFGYIFSPFIPFSQIL
ncbi:MAG: hypothetical protein ACI86H_001566 [bacterium]|jgi:hypothetical protein